MLERISTQHNSQMGIAGFSLNLGRGLFLGGLLATPWMIGGLPYWATLITASLFLALAILIGLVSLFNRSAGSISKISIILGILLAYPALQLLPLSSNHPLERLEHATDSKLVSSANITIQTEFKRYPISCAPYKTRRTLATYATGFVIFLFSGILWNTPGRLRLLFLALTANGVVLSLFGMVQKFRWDGAIYGLYHLQYGGQPFASFVNRNNAAAYLLVCLAAGVGLLMSRSSNSDEQGYHHSSDRSSEHRLLIGFSLILIAAGIVASLSRGGILSAAIAAVVVLAMASRNGKTILTTLGGLGGVSALAIWFGWGSDLLSRFAVLQRMNFNEIGRIQHWKNTLPAMQDFGITGSGLGTYSMVNRPYQPLGNQSWFVNADNQYLEWALELGGIGFALIILTLACLFLMTKKLLNSSRKIAGFRYTLGITALFLLVSQLVHAIFDFGITLPATLLSVAAILGAISSYFAGNFDGGGNFSDEKINSQYQLSWNPILAFGCLVVMASAFVVTGTAYQDEKIARQITQSIQDIPNSSVEQLHELRKKLVDRAEENSESPLLFESLVQIDQALMRLEFLKNQGASDPLEVGRYWESSYPARLALTVSGQDSLTQTLHRVWKKEELVTASQSYEDSLLKSIQLNPLNGHLWRELGILNWMRSQDQNKVIQQLEYATMLRPADLNTQMIYAMELANFGEEQAATRLFQNLMTHFPQDADRIWEASRRCYPIETIVQKILPADVSIWEGIWELLSIQKEKSEALLQFAVSISDRLEKKPTEKKTPSGLFLLAVASDLTGNTEVALELMNRAVHQKPLEADWRREYARMLVQSGQVDAARKQLETAYRISPNDRRIEAAYRNVLSLRSDKAKD